MDERQFIAMLQRLRNSIMQSPEDRLKSLGSATARGAGGIFNETRRTASELGQQVVNLARERLAGPQSQPQSQPAQPQQQPLGPVEQFDPSRHPWVQFVRQRFSQQPR